MDTQDRDLDAVLLDDLDAVVLAALGRIGDDPEARFRFLRWLLAMAQEAALGRSWSQAAPKHSSTAWANESVADRG